MKSMKKTMVRATGFGSPAEAYIDDETDWTGILFPKPHAMYVFTLQGGSLEQEGIREGDYLIIDSSCRPSAGKLVVAVLEGEFCLGRFESFRGRTAVRSGTEIFPFTEDGDVRIFGVVTRLLRMFPS